MNPEHHSKWRMDAKCGLDKSLGIDQKRLLDVFSAQNIDARVFFWPLSSLPMFKENLSNKHSYDLPNRSINLPSFHDITDDQINLISDIIINLVNNS